MVGGLCFALLDRVPSIMVGAASVIPFFYFLKASNLEGLMRRLALISALAIAIIASPALGAPCTTALAGPDSKVDGGAFSLAIMESNGTVNYAGGAISFAPSFYISTPSGVKIPRPQRWYTADNQLAKLFRDIRSVLAGSNKVEPFVSRPLSLAISGLVTPTVTIKFLDTTQTVTFAATCNSSKILYGSSQGKDYLINVGYFPPR